MSHSIPPTIQDQPMIEPVRVIGPWRGPEASGLTREEIRRIVLDLIG